MSCFLDFFPLLILLGISLIHNLVLVDRLWRERHIGQLSLSCGITWTASFTYLSVISPRTENHCVLYFSRMFWRPMNVWSSPGNCLCLFSLIKTLICSLKSSFTTLQEPSSKSKGQILRSHAWPTVSWLMQMWDRTGHTYRLPITSLWVLRRRAYVIIFWWRKGTNIGTKKRGRCWNASGVRVRCLFHRKTGAQRGTVP